MNQAQYEARNKFINTVAQMAADARMSDEQVVKTFHAVWAKPEYENLDLLPVGSADEWDRLQLAIDQRITELRYEPAAGCAEKPAQMEIEIKNIEKLGDKWNPSFGLEVWVDGQYVRWEQFTGWQNLNNRVWLIAFYQKWAYRTYKINAHVTLS